MFKLDELKVFIATAEAGSFVGAANQLEVTPSVISKSIRNLENKLSTTLFNRTTRKIQITCEGEWLLNQAIKTMGSLEKIQTRFIDNNAEPKGRLTIDAVTPFALHVIAPVISKFTALYPKIDISIESNETITDLIASRVDVAIRLGTLKDSTLKAKKIGSSQRALYASPGYITQHGEPLHVRELENHKCLGFTQPKSLNIWPMRTENGEWVAINPHMRATSGETLKQLAMFDNGIACISEFAVQEELKRGELIRLLADQTVPQSIPIYAVYYSERAVGPHIRIFLDFLKEHTKFTI